MDKVSGFGQLNIIDSKMMQGITANMQEGVDASAEAGSLTSQVVSSTDTVNLSQASRSMMAGNFVSSGSVEDHQSKYVQGRQAGNDAVLMQANRQDAILSSGMAEVAAMSEKDRENYAKRAQIGNRAARRMKEEMQQASMEASERNLDEQRESVEENAARAVEGTEDGATQGMAASSSEVQPAPAASAAPARGAEAAAVQAESVALEVAAPPVAAPAASIPSVDIIV